MEDSKRLVVLRPQCGAVLRFQANDKGPIVQAGFDNVDELDRDVNEIILESRPWYHFVKSLFTVQEDCNCSFLFYWKILPVLPQVWLAGLK